LLGLPRPAQAFDPHFRCRAFQALVTRGVEWAAPGKVNIPALP